MSENHSVILQLLQKLDDKIDDIGKEVQNTNIEMAKLSSIKHAIGDFKSWKEGIESAVNSDDLREMKSALSETKKNTQDIIDSNKELDRLKTESDNDKKEIKKLNTFKTKVITIGSVAIFVISAAFSIIGLIMKS